jgi:VWFA-related protein
MHGTSLRTAVIALASGAWLVAAPQQPVFRARTDVVPVDVIVVDKAGRPITDLKTEDFTLSVDGKPRRLSAVELVRFNDRQAARPDPTAIPSIRPDQKPAPAAEYTSNASSTPGRMFVIAVDEGNITRGGGRAAMQAASLFIDRLAPNDLVGLVSLPVGVTVDFTANRSTIRSALGKIVGGGANRYQSRLNCSMAEAFALVTGNEKRLWDEAVAQECIWARNDTEYATCKAQLDADARHKFATARSAAEQSEEALKILIGQLGRVEGQKHVIFISEGLVTGSSFGYLDGFGDLAWLGSLAQAARVNLYVLHLDRAFLEAFNVSERFPSRTPIEDAHLLNDGLGQLAGLAGGGYFRLITAMDSAFDRIARETSAAYLVTFDTQDSDRDGKKHRIAVKVDRPGVEVRARTQFTADPASVGPTPGERLSRALNSPFLPPTLPVGVATYVVGDSQNSGVHVLVAVEIGCAATDPGSFDVGYTVTDAAGRGSGSAVDRAATTVPRANGDRCAYYASNFTTKPGDYTLKVAGLDAGYRLGGVEHRVNARLVPAGPLGLSSLVMTDPAVRVDGRMKLLVDGYVLGRSVSAYIAMQRLQPDAGGGTGSKPTVQFEIASEDGVAVLARGAGQVREDAEPGRWYTEELLNLSALPPGTYLVRAVVSVDGEVAGRVSRQIVTSAPRQSGGPAAR